MSVQAELAQIGARLADQTTGGIIAATDGADDWVVPFGVVDERGRAGIAADPAHVFRFTSISKPFTAIQVLTLVDEAGSISTHLYANTSPSSASPTKGRSPRHRCCLTHRALIRRPT
jgi:CubicO group peptidase (beta-lactamase class C family)